MARVKMVKPDTVDDPVIREIFEWVTAGPYQLRFLKRQLSLPVSTMSQ